MLVPQSGRERLKWQLSILLSYCDLRIQGKPSHDMYLCTNADCGGGVARPCLLLQWSNVCGWTPEWDSQSGGHQADRQAESQASSRRRAAQRRAQGTAATRQVASGMWRGRGQTQTQWSQHRAWGGRDQVHYNHSLVQWRILALSIATVDAF